LLLLFPLLLAYGLEGAKKPFGFFLVFLAVSVLFYQRILKPGLCSIPLRIFIPFGLYFLWMWQSLLHNPPIDACLHSLARIFLYYLFAVLVLNEKRDLTVAFGIMILTLGIVESLLIRINYSRLQAVYLEQFGGRLGNPLHSGILIPMAFAVALSIFLPSFKKDKNRVVVSILAMGLLLYATFLLRSRAAMLSIGVIIFLALPKSLRKAVWVIGGFVCLLLFYFARHQILRYLEIDTYGLLSTMGRFSIWKTDLLALKAHPLFGYGLGNFEYAFMQFHQPSSEFLRYGKTTIFAHNGFLQTAIDGGLPALFFLLWGIRNIWSLVSSNSHLNDKSFALNWRFWGIAVYAVTSLFNYSLFLPFNGLVFAACVGLLMSEYEVVTQPSISIRLFQLSLKCLMGFFCLFLFLSGIADLFAANGRVDMAARFMPANSDYWYQMALNEMADNKEAGGVSFDSTRVLANLKRAALWNPHDPFVYSRIGRVLNATRHGAQRAEIESAFEQAETISPKHAPFWVEHGFYLLSVRQWQHAGSNFQRAADLEPNAPLPLYGWAVVSMHGGNFSQALRLLTAARALKQNEQKVADESAYNKELLTTPYGEYLYSVDVPLLDRLIVECSSRSIPSTAR
jgi:O-antigen ligase